MSYPPMLNGKTPAEYRTFFEAMYCRNPIQTFDRIEVRFRKRDFNHCFFESVKSKDDTFSLPRAERLLWIKAALQDPDSEKYIGWDRHKKRYDKNRRVTLVQKDYVVVIVLLGNQKAEFITAYVADTPTTLAKIRSSPKWV